MAESRYEMLAEIMDPDGNEEIAQEWILNNSFNSITYEEIFTLPDDGPAGEQYYAIQFGDVYLFAARTAD